MKIRKPLKITAIVLASLLLLIIIFTAAMFISQSLTDQRINDDYAAVLSDEAYNRPVSVDGVSFIEQRISCGYAIIEMLSHWQGKDITEQSLSDENGGAITTAMGDGFLNEMTRQFPEWQTTRHRELTNSELLKTVYASLAAGMPVPIEFAAQRLVGDEKTWTLHFAVVTAVDLRRDSIVVQNPYGYEEVYSTEDFLNATRYDSYENMEFFLKLGFVFGLFGKNTVYTISE